MRKIVCLLILLLAGQMLFAQVQNYIGIVRPQKNENVLKFEEEQKEENRKKTLSKSQQKKLDEKKDEEKKDDKKDKDDDEDEKEPENKGYDKKINTNVFGTGFVYVLKDGTNYIITNHHVVGDAEKACIEFIDPATGDKKLYEDLEIIGLSDDVDLALLKFPNGKKPFKESFPFFDGTLSDGMEVYSAGYPGLQSTPSWQFAKGNVSNARAEIKELMDPEYSYIVQHSAPIDPGNSGGPLLIADKNTKTGYRVAGVNTWKAYNRSLAGFTIPAETVLKFVDSVLNPPKDTEELIKKRAEDFSKALTKNYTNASAGVTVYTEVQKYISNEYAASITYKQFQNMGKMLGIGTWNYTKYDLITDRKYAITCHIVTKYRAVKQNKDKDDPESTTKFYKYTVDKITKNADNTYSVNFVCNDEKKNNTIESVWVKEFGIWRIKSISYTPESTDYKNEKKYNIDKDHVSNGFVTANTLCCNMDSYNFMMPLVGEDIDSYYFGFSYRNEDFSKNWATMAYGFSWQYKENLNHLFLEMGASFGFNLFFGNYVTVMPKAGIFVMADVFTSNPAGGWFYDAGVAFRFGKTNRPVCSVIVSYKDTYVYSLRETQGNYNYGSLGIGIEIYIPSSSYMW